MNTEIFEQFEEFDELKEVRLEKMIDVQFSEEALRKNFELILKVLKSHRLSLCNLQKLMEDPNEKEQLKKNVKSNTDKIEKLEKENSELKEEIQKLNDRPQTEQTTVIQQQISEPGIDPAIIEELKQNDENQMNEINELKDELNQYKEKANQQIQNVVIKMNEKEDAMNERVDTVMTDLNSLKQMIEDLLEKQRMMDEFRNSQNSQGEEPNSGVSNDMIIELKFQINKQGKQLTEMNEKFVTHPQLNEAIKNVEQTISDLSNQQEEKHKQIDQDIEDLRNQLRLLVPYTEFEAKTDTLDTKFASELNNLKHVYLTERFGEIQQSIDYFNDEIANSKSSIIQLFNLFNQINSGMALLNEKGEEKPIVPVMQAAPSVDHSPKIQALENKIKAMEAQLQKVSQQQSEHLDNYRNFVEKNENMIQKLSKTKLDKSEYRPQLLSDQIQALRDKINTIYNQYQQTDLQVKQNEEDITNIFNKLSQKNSKVKETTEVKESSGIDSEQILILIKKQTDIPLKDLLKMIQDLDKKLNERALKSELDEIAKVLRDLMDQMKKLADRNETKKGFITLEKKINELYQIVMGDERDKNLDGLLVKRPLGWACCSCDKELNNYQGLTGEHINWAIFPPKETSPLRMGKYAIHYAEINNKKSPQQSMTKTTMLEGEQNQSSSLFLPPSIQTNDQFYNQQQYQPQTVKSGHTMFTLKPVFHPKSKAYKIVKNNQFRFQEDGDMKVQGKKTKEDF